MTNKVGLIGWPVEHSISPAMHNAAFSALGLDWRYDPLPVLPSEVGRRVDALLDAGYCGFNVTVPHKQEVLRLNLIREAEDAVQEIGAANTLTLLGANGGLRASNTDWLGFTEDLAAHGVEIKGLDCYILGTGGGSKAVSYALQRGGANSWIRVSRTKGEYDAIIGYEDLEVILQLPLEGSRQTLIVNCTPVGMWPNADASPWPEGVSFPKDAILYDLVYNPGVTRLMQQAEAQGAKVIGGLGMLVRQGARSFEQWTGIVPPLDVMEKAARGALAESTGE